MKRLGQVNECDERSVVSVSLAETTTDFIGFTIKPQCTRHYTALTPIRQSKLLKDKLVKSIDRLKKHVNVVGYELHYERFQNGNLHAHGCVWIEGSLHDTVWADQLEKDFLAHNMGLGKYCIKCKLPFGETKTWIEYINKSNVLEPVYSRTPYGIAQLYEFIED